MDNITAAPLNPTSLKPAESSRNIWRVTAAIGTQRKDMLSPNYWTHVAMKLKPNDLIEVIAEDQKFFASYIVLSCDRTWARVHELNYVVFEAVPITKEDAKKLREDYDVKYRGEKKWCVIRKNGTVLQENMHSKADAELWLDTHLGSQHAAA